MADVIIKFGLAAMLWSFAVLIAVVIFGLILEIIRSKQ